MKLIIDSADAQKILNYIAASPSPGPVAQAIEVTDILRRLQPLDEKPKAAEMKTTGAEAGDSPS